MKQLLPFTLLLIAFFTITNLAAQQQRFMGAHATLEKGGALFSPGLGVVFEQQLTKKSGIETGVFYRTYVLRGDITYFDSTGISIYPFTLAEHYISIPILYKFHTRLVAVSVGPTFDLFTGSHQRQKKNLSATITNHDTNPDFSVGLLARVSKRFSLPNNLFLEPDVRFNPTSTTGRKYWGIGLAMKRSL